MITTENVKEYLWQSCKLRYKVKALKEEKNDAESLKAMQYDSNFAAVSKSNSAEAKNIKVSELSMQIDLELSKLDKVMAETLKFISQIKDGKLEAVMIYKYLRGLTPTEIADEMEIAKREYYRYHDTAINILAEIENSKEFSMLEGIECHSMSHIGTECHTLTQNMY